MVYWPLCLILKYQKDKILEMKLGKRLLKTLLVLPVNWCTSCETHTQTNAEDYLDLVKEIKENFDFHTHLYTFPETIEGKEIKKFYYQETEVPFTGSYFFYLVLEYAEEDYQSELERLANVKAVYSNGVVKPIIAYPEQNAFLSIMKDNRYEYVLYDSETLEICYLSNQLYRWDELGMIEERHKMPEFVIPSEYDDGENSYNMYYWFTGDVGYEVEWDS